MSSVLYDTPGPRAKRRNVLLSVVFFLLLALLLWWVWLVMDDNNQLEWDLWEPFTTAQAWTTYLLPGLANTLKAAALAMVIALPLGAVFGIARLSDHRWVRGVAGTVVEFFRAIPVLLLMLFANELYVRSTDISSEQRPLYAVVTGLVLYNASVLAEIVRAGILSLPKGQTEAASAVGLRKGPLQLEVTTYRADVYDRTSRKPEVMFGDSLEGDLVRRDFAVNAMAIRLPSLEFVDVHGGLDDLAARRLMTPERGSRRHVRRIGGLHRRQRRRHRRRA